MVLYMLCVCVYEEALETSQHVASLQLPELPQLIDKCLHLPALNTASLSLSLALSERPILQT